MTIDRVDSPLSGEPSPELVVSDGELPRIYDELAAWWPLFSSPADYAEEAALYQRILLDALGPPPHTMLELGSGGGNNALYLKSRFEMTLADRSPGMLDVSRALNPECEHVVGDMRTLRLGRRFDCVFIHDAIVWMTTREDLRQAVETAFAHCAPGGVALFVPDDVRETFRTRTSQGGHDGEDRGLRYLKWIWDPDPDDHTFVVDFAFMLRDGTGTVRVIHDRHIEGLFPRAVWDEIFTGAGFEPAQGASFTVDGPAFACRRPA